VIQEKIPDATKDLHFHHRPVSLKEQCSESIWPRSFGRTNTGEGLDHLNISGNSIEKEVIFYRDNRIKKIKHIFFNWRSCGREHVGKMRDKIFSNFNSIRNPSPIRGFQKVHNIRPSSNQSGDVEVISVKVPTLQPNFSGFRPPQRFLFQK
jgi:hypothetical protein